MSTLVRQASDFQTMIRQMDENPAKAYEFLRKHPSTVMVLDQMANLRGTIHYKVDDKQVSRTLTGRNRLLLELRIYQLVQWITAFAPLLTILATFAVLWLTQNWASLLAVPLAVALDKWGFNLYSPAKNQSVILRDLLETSRICARIMRRMSEFRTQEASK